MSVTAMDDTTETVEARILKQWTESVSQILHPLAMRFGSVEGNLFCTKECRGHDEFLHKQKNMIHFVSKYQPARALEVGFNAGYGSFLILLSSPSSKLDCVDICEHAYVQPCHACICNTLLPCTTEAPRLIVGDSHRVLKNLQPGVYDFIHVDGDHSRNGAFEDIKDSIRLARHQAIIVIDDTNLAHIRDVCSIFVRDGLLRPIEAPFSSKSRKYDHSFFQVSSNS